MISQQLSCFDQDDRPLSLGSKSIIILWIFSYEKSSGPNSVNQSIVHWVSLQKELFAESDVSLITLTE